MSSSVACALHQTHCPSLHDTDDHHVVPKSWFEKAGIAVQTPHALICPTGHRNVHLLIDHLVEHGGVFDWDFAKHYAAAERDLALQGYTLGVQDGLTPSATL